MKYLAMGIGILSLLLSLCLLTAWLTSLYLEETAQPLRGLNRYFETEDYGSMLSVIEDSKSVWDSHHGYFSSILHHSELEEVGYCFASMTAYAEQGELAELRDSYTRLMAILDHLKKMDRPSYYNILAFATHHHELLP